MREQTVYDTIENTNRPFVKSSLRESVRNLSFLYPYIKKHKRTLLISVIAIIAVAVLVILLGRESRILIDNKFFIHDAQKRLVAILNLLGIISLLALSSFGRSYYVSWLGERVATDVRKDIFNKVLNLDVSFFEDVRAGEIVSRLTIDMGLIQVVLGNSIAIGLRNILLLASGVAMMVATSIPLSLYTLAIVPFVIVPIALFGRTVQKFSKQAHDHLAHMGGYLDETLTHIRTVQAFTHEKIDELIFRNYAEASFKSATSRNYAKSLLSVVVMLSVSFGIIAMLWTGAAAIIQDQLTAGSLTAFIIYACVVAGATSSFSDIVLDIHRAAAGAERLCELLKVKPLLSEQDLGKKILKKPARGIVAVHNVSFAYPSNSERLILDKVTFSVSPGENLALVGPSGAGKSTISSLILRFYDPQSGSIYLDGNNIKDLSVSELRSHIALVRQDPTLFSTTIYENILYGNPGVNEQEVQKAIKLSGVENFLDDLPNGAHSLVGTDGVRLSSGQKQRIAIARAILRDPTVFLLDEATNALDAENEEAVQKALKNLTANRTTIVIAHRLATVLRCDKIVVLDHGVVQAVGTHAELISYNSLYRRLVTLQFPDAVALGFKPDHRNRYNI